MKSWYTIKAQGESSLEIDIFDEIGFWGVTAKDFINDLKRYPDVSDITVRINSYGGEVFDGVAIYNALKRHPANVTVVVYGVAASIASVIAMAGDKIVMPENTYMFIHDPLALVIGDADDMREMAEALEKIAAGLIASYVAKSGKDEKEVRKWMNDDSWFTAAEALEAGLADEVTTAVKIAANASISRFKNLPESLKPFTESAPASPPAAASPPAPPPGPSDVPHHHEFGVGNSLNKFIGKIEECPLCKPLKDEDKPPEDIEEIKEIVSLCNKAGVPEAAAEFLDKGFTLDQVKARVADADKIRARCIAAKMPERANGYIKAGMSAAEAGDALFDILRARQGAEIDNHIGPEGERKKKPQTKMLTAAEIYAMRNKR